MTNFNMSETMKKSPLPPKLKNIPKGYIYLGRGKEVVYPEKWESAGRTLDQEFQLPDWGFADTRYGTWGWFLLENMGKFARVGWTNSENDVYIIAKKDSVLHKLQNKKPETVSLKEENALLKEENARLKEEIKKWEEWAVNNFFPSAESIPNKGKK